VSLIGDGLASETLNFLKATRIARVSETKAIVTFRLCFGCRDRLETIKLERTLSNYARR
jgi:hypothetical protein